MSRLARATTQPKQRTTKKRAKSLVSSCASPPHEFAARRTESLRRLPQAFVTSIRDCYLLLPEPAPPPLPFVGLFGVVVEFVFELAGFVVWFVPFVAVPFVFVLLLTPFGVVVAFELESVFIEPLGLMVPVPVPVLAPVPVFVFVSVPVFVPLPLRWPQVPPPISAGKTRFGGATFCAAAPACRAA